MDGMICTQDSKECEYIVDGLVVGNHYANLCRRKYFMAKQGTETVCNAEKDSKFIDGEWRTKCLTIKTV
jgi:hypothetical protein